MRQILILRKKLACVPCFSLHYYTSPHAFIVLRYAIAKYIISASAVIPHDTGYSKYKDSKVPKRPNTVYIHTIRNTHEPIITIAVGTKLLPIPREAAIVQSINGANHNENAIILRCRIPASITASSGENIIIIYLPKTSIATPNSVANITPYDKDIT